MKLGLIAIGKLIALAELRSMQLVEKNNLRNYCMEIRISLFAPKA